MLKQKLKRMVLTGATVMVPMSTAVPSAMAAPAGYQDGYQDYELGFWWSICIINPKACQPPEKDIIKI